MATRFVPRACIIRTWNQPSWLCSTCWSRSWMRRWEKGWVSSIKWQYYGMLRIVYSKILPTFRKFVVPSFLDWFSPKIKSIKTFETSVCIPNWHRITYRNAWMCTHTAVRHSKLASSCGYSVKCYSNFSILVTYTIQNQVIKDTKLTRTKHIWMYN
jgi:hypothetical protein